MFCNVANTELEINLTQISMEIFYIMKQFYL